MLRSPLARQARMTRRAISPRLAISTDEKLIARLHPAVYQVQWGTLHISGRTRPEECEGAN